MDSKMTKRVMSQSVVGPEDAVAAKESDRAILVKTAEDLDDMLQGMAKERVESVEGVIVASGNRYDMVFPMTISSPAEKDQYFDTVRAMMLVEEVERYYAMCEVWLPRTDPVTGKVVKDEAVAVICRSRLGGIQGLYAIGRGADGRIDSLTRDGDWEDVFGESRLGDLLAPSPTPQLKAAAQAWLDALQSPSASRVPSDEPNRAARRKAQAKARS